MDALLTLRRRHLLAAMGAGILAAACGRGADARTLRLDGASMGTTWSVRIAGVPVDAAITRRAHDAVAGALDAVVARMSTFDAASELSRFNRHRATTPLALSADLLDVLAQAQSVAAASGGAFDATVAPLVAAWGFGAGAQARGRAPTPEELMQPVDWRALHVDSASGVARKSLPALQLDLSGIAKGHAVDSAALALEALGIERYMVEAGGEVRTLGRNADDRPWQIGIERPDAWPQRVHRIVPLAGLSVATSGDYRNCYQQDGRRVHHEIDPATRAPAAHALASVSVLHADCMRADAWATALFVRGPDQGPALARQLGLAALFIVRDGAQLRDITSPAFDAALAA
jgi:thiamine biosynthesis lipoprotein